MAKTFTAKYEGHCYNCGDPIEPGDDVTYDDDEIVHAECAEDVDG